jgi:hypothetical protein
MPPRFLARDFVGVYGNDLTLGETGCAGHPIELR